MGRRNRKNRTFGSDQYEGVKYTSSNAYSDKKEFAKPYSSGSWHWSDWDYASHHIDHIRSQEVANVANEIFGGSYYRHNSAKV